MKRFKIVGLFLLLYSSYEYGISRNKKGRHLPTNQ